MTTSYITATSTIHDGNMSLKLGDELTVLAHRHQFLQSQGSDWLRHICMRCDHGDAIVMVSGDTLVDQYRMIDAEVLVTTDPTLTLMLLTADCLPVTFFDPVQRVLALAHFSRQTIAAHLPTETIAFLQTNNDVDPITLEVHIGPHIHAASYRFSLPLPHVDPVIAPFITERDGFAYIDLTAATVAQLTAAGIQKNNITIDPADTGTDDRYFSYYRTKHENRPDGRIATIAGMH